MKPHPLEQPASGHYRIACGESCDVTIGGQKRQGLIWNLSVVGVYLVLSSPLPAAAETLLLTFTLPGDPAPITGQGRVRWLNPPSIFQGCGRHKMALPPGCGIEFTVLDTRDAERIAARVQATVTSAR
jgi:hypothetical protein